MMIKDKVRFAIGVIDVLGGLACLTTCIYLHSGSKTALTIVPITCGVASLVQSIEPEAQRWKRKEELQAMAKMYEWNKGGDTE